MKLYKQIWEAIAEGIKEDIINGNYRLGEPLKENELAQKYSSSKTPVKEALRYLEGIGFIEIVPYKGARVKNMDEKEVLSLYNILGALEGLAASQAITHLDEKHFAKMKKYAGQLSKYFHEKAAAKYEKTNITFHSIVWDAIDDKPLTDLIINIREKLQRYRIVTRRYLDKFDTISAEHQTIIELLIKKDIQETEIVIRNHYKKSGELVVSLMSK